METPVRKQCSSPKWFAVYTRSRMEKKASVDLTNRDIECYLPTMSVTRIWGKQSRKTTLPLISGYIFVRVTPKEFYQVLFAPGVLRYVCFDGKPAVITDYQMETLKLFIRNGENDIRVSSEKIHKGDLVRITEGALKDRIAEIVEIRGKKRILARINQLGCSIHIDLGDTKVVAIKCATKPKEETKHSKYHW